MSLIGGPVFRIDTAWDFWKLGLAFHAPTRTIGVMIGPWTFMLDLRVPPKE